MHRLDCKNRLKEKMKLKDVLQSKNMDTAEIDLEVEKLKSEYEDSKKIEEPKLNLLMNNTEGLLYKGRILGAYFSKNTDEQSMMHFSLEDEKGIGGKEVIDFKSLRKEEEARRYFDYYCCLNFRKKFNTKEKTFKNIDYYL